MCVSVCGSGLVRVGVSVCVCERECVSKGMRVWV